MTPTDLPIRQSRTARGRDAEDLATALYERRGYATLARNWRGGRGELDLVCRRGDLVVFVEVRSARGAGFGLAVESVTPRKLYRLRSAARAFLAARGLGAARSRFDLVAYQRAADGRVLDCQVIEGISE